MRNFFVYARSRDNQFFSCSVIVNCQAPLEADELAQRIMDAATRKFEAMNNPLPHPDDLLRFRAVMDPRNDLEEAEYPCRLAMDRKPVKSRSNLFKPFKRKP